MPPGTPVPTIDLRVFYADVRGNRFGGTYSLISVAAPIGIFAAAVGFAAWMLSDAQSAPNLGLHNSAEVPKLPIEAFCGTDQQHAPLQLGVIAGTIHFAAAHAALLTACLVAYAASAIFIRNVLRTHRIPQNPALGWSVALAAPVAGGAIVFGCCAWSLGSQIHDTALRLFPVTAGQDCKVLFAADQLKRLVDWQVRIGARSVSIGVTALVLAAAAATFRFERGDINGVWSKGFVLRHKLDGVLTLFFVGSILLVITNFALTSALDWLSGILNVVSAATQSSDKSAAPDATKAVAAAFSAIDTLKGSLANFISVVSSLVLIAIFAPALYGLSGEIAIAGKCHGYYDALKKDPASRPDPYQKIFIASWETLEDWKKRHGLSLSYTNLTASFVAVLAPLLSSRLIDLAKVVPIPGVGR